MTVSYKRQKYLQEWDKEHTVQKKLKLNKTTDADILEWIDALDNFQGYVKNLIRADMKNKK